MRSSTAASPTANRRAQHLASFHGSTSATVRRYRGLATARFMRVTVRHADFNFSP